MRSAASQASGTAGRSRSGCVARVRLSLSRGALNACSGRCGVRPPARRLRAQHDCPGFAAAARLRVADRSGGDRRLRGLLAAPDAGLPVAPRATRCRSSTRPTSARTTPPTRRRRTRRCPASDSNQQLSLTDQLRLDVRSLEIDVHYVRRPAGRLPRRAVPTRATPAAPPSAPSPSGCPRSATGSRRNPREVLLLYVEDHLRGGYDEGAEVLEAGLGPFLYRPPAGECTPMPLGLSRARDPQGGQAGARDLELRRGLGLAARWSSTTRRATSSRADPSDFEGYPALRLHRPLPALLRGLDRALVRRRRLPGRRRPDARRSPAR